MTAAHFNSLVEELLTRVDIVRDGLREVLLHFGTETLAVGTTGGLDLCQLHHDTHLRLTGGSGLGDRFLDDGGKLFGTSAKALVINGQDGSRLTVVTAQITTLAIDAGGNRFASAGLDRLVKLFAFDEGTVLATGCGHAGAVRRVCVAPDGAALASVGDDGAIFLWRMPPLMSESEAPSSISS